MYLVGDGGGVTSGSMLLPEPGGWMAGIAGLVSSVTAADCATEVKACIM